LRLAIEIAVYSGSSFAPKSTPRKFVALKTIKGERIRRGSDAGKLIL